MNINKSYKKLEKYFKNKGIDIGYMFYVMTEHKTLTETTDKNQDVTTKKLSEQCSLIPTYSELKSKEIEVVSQSLKEYIKKYC